MKILVAEDDAYTREGLVEILRAEGYETVAAENGTEALEMYRTESPDVACLDVMMPGINGYDVCREIRRKNEGIPILFISAKSEEIDKVLGLELGADDFIVKPFGVKEVIARVRAVTRRYFTTVRDEAESFHLGDLTVMPAELRAYRGDIRVELSIRDVNILKTFFANQGKVLSRDTLFSAGWGIEHLPNSRTLDQHISQLRRRIEIDPKCPKIICTVHGAGYRYP
ncbi:MAG: DNA-binding response regulator [Spirochaetales bacterium]|nr:DNA-binding response regulator [Spirochaetales bacterium]